MRYLTVILLFISFTAFAQPANDVRIIGFPPDSANFYGMTYDTVSGSPTYGRGIPKDSTWWADALGVGAGGGNGIYDGSGTVPTSVIATLTDDLELTNADDVTSRWLRFDNISSTTATDLGLEFVALNNSAVANIYLNNHVTQDDLVLNNTAGDISLSMIGGTGQFFRFNQDGTATFNKYGGSVAGSANLDLVVDGSGNLMTRALTAGGITLTQEEVEDFAFDVTRHGSGTQSLITVAYDDPNNQVDYTVEPNLSNYTNDVGWITEVTGLTDDAILFGSLGGTISQSGELLFDDDHLKLLARMYVDPDVVSVPQAGRIFDGVLNSTSTVENTFPTILLRNRSNATTSMADIGFFARDGLLKAFFRADGFGDYFPAAGFGIAGTRDYPFYINVNDVTEFTILSGGNVGISDATPTFLLDVNGTGRFVGDLELDEDLVDISGDVGTAGQLLSSLGTGLGTDWIAAPSGADGNGIFSAANEGALTGVDSVVIGNNDISFVNNSDHKDYITIRNTGSINLVTNSLGSQRALVWSNGTSAYDLGNDSGENFEIRYNNATLMEMTEGASNSVNFFSELGTGSVNQNLNGFTSSKLEFWEEDIEAIFRWTLKSTGSNFLIEPEATTAGLIGAILMRNNANGNVFQWDTESAIQKYYDQTNTGTITKIMAINATGEVGFEDASAINTFLGSADGNGIYDGSGTVPTTTVATVTDSLTFDGAYDITLDGVKSGIDVVTATAGALNAFSFYNGATRWKIGNDGAEDLLFSYDNGSGYVNAMEIYNGTNNRIDLLSNGVGSSIFHITGHTQAHFYFDEDDFPQSWLMRATGGDFSIEPETSDAEFQINNQSNIEVFKVATSTGILTASQYSSGGAITGTEVGLLGHTSAGKFTSIPLGTDNQVLTMDGTTSFTWETPSGSSEWTLNTGELYPILAATTVGIGTLTPNGTDYMLDVEGDINADQVIIGTATWAGVELLVSQSATGTTSPISIFQNTNVGDNYIEFDGDTEDFSIGGDNSEGTFVIANGTDLSSDLLSITTAGLVGIGVTATEEFHVRTSVNPTLLLETTGAAGISIYKTLGAFNGTGIVATWQAKNNDADISGADYFLGQVDFEKNNATTPGGSINFKVQGENTSSTFPTVLKLVGDEGVTSSAHIELDGGIQYKQSINKNASYTINPSDYIIYKNDATASVVYTLLDESGCVGCEFIISNLGTVDMDVALTGSDQANNSASNITITANNSIRIINITTNEWAYFNN